ncbi:tetratricopeptide repeat protein [Neobacillus niacini]|uniref:tetratricopeptide repeat protein n=1 Tax=Neobacillus niacini TaxID=86668 RepID=UPI003982D82E
MITKLKSLYDQKQYDQALEIINQEIQVFKSLRYSEFKHEVTKINSAEDFQVLIRLTDHFLMYQYSSFLARYAYRRFPCFLTLSWYCEELLDNGKLLEADELISSAIAEIQDNIQDGEECERLYFCKIRCLLEMKLFKEAEELLEKLKESPRPHYDKIGFVYMHTGDRESAEKYFQQGLKDAEKGQICYLLLADLKASNGQIEEALALIEKGESLYPETPSFILEKIRRYRDLGKMAEMLALIEELNERITDHAYRKYFHHLTKTAYYQLGDYQRLKEEVKGEKSLFTVKNEQGECIKLTIKPIIQKSNYCVPASLEMILTFFGEEITQDEIANHIFDFTGSKLSTTVDYLETNGYECRYFVGRKELYQELLRKQIPILLSVDFEHSSHVQVMTGYDGVFDFYHIQEPNLLETMYVSANDLENANVSTSYMSIVCVPKDRARELSFLSKEEDDYFRQLQDLGEKLEEDEEKYKEAFLEFLKNTIDVPYSPIYVVKHFSFEEYDDFILQCAKRLLLTYPNNDFMNLHVSQAYMRLHRMEEAREQLKLTQRKTFSPLYHFLNGRIALYFDETREAVGYFRTSLQLDPDQYYTWSYLALSYLYSKNVKKAEYFSAISMELAPKERFVRINHAAVLIEKQEYARAREIYNKLIRELPRDGHAWYERARLDQKLGNIRKALRGFLMSIKLENHVPFAVLAAADLYDYELEEPEKAEEILLSAIHTSVSAQLLIRLGDFYREHEESDKCMDCFQQCIELFPDEGFAYIGLAEIIAHKENKEMAVAFLKKQAARFKKDSEYLINSGSMMAEWALEEDNLQLAEESLALIESGINHIHSNYNEALEIYVKIAGDTPFINSAIDFLQQKFTNHSSVIEFKCYEGTLYEEKQQYSSALKCYNTALQVREDAFPYYRIGEVYFKLRMYELAANAYKTCINIDPANESALLRLAEIAAFNENHEEEAEFLLRVLDIEPLSVNIEYLVSILDEDRKQQLLAFLQSLPKGFNEIWRLDAEGYVFGALGEIQLEQEKVSAALQMNPEFSELLNHQAKIFIKAKKWKDARTLLTLLLNKNPDNVEVYRTLIIYSAAANKWSRLPNILTKLEGNVEGKSRRFLLAAEAGKQFIAEMNWSGKKEGNAFGRFVAKLKNRTKQINLFGTIIELYEMAMKLDKNNLAAVSHFARFYEEFELGDEAVKILQKALKKQWDDRLAYQLGMNYLDMEAYQAALPLFERQLNSDPDDYHLRYLAALCHGEIGEVRIAEEMLISIIEENPFEPNVHFRLGCLLNAQGRHLGAKDVLEKGMEYHPYDTEIRKELLVTKHHLEKSILQTN